MVMRFLARAARTFTLSSATVLACSFGSEFALAQGELSPPRVAADEYALPPSPPAIATDGAVQVDTSTTTTATAAELNSAEAAPAPAPAPKKKPKPAPYKGVFYDNDFKYLDDPKNTEPEYLGDCLKRLHCGDCWTWDFGGEFRLRHHVENHLRGSNLSGRSDDFLLERTRLYANGEYAGWLRLYAEAIDANSDFERYTPRPIEENRFDALNLFIDARVWDGCNGDLWVRGGRQELLYGSERLISPLDWSNTRRTFDGVKTMWKGTDWNIDTFWMRPVPFAQHVQMDTNFDSSNDKESLIGVWGTYKAIKNETLDLYFLSLASAVGDTAPAIPAGSDVELFAGRYTGKNGSFLWDFEGGYQFGNWAGRTQAAGFVTLGAGHENACHCWKPQWWFYWDYASGDHNPNDNVHGTFFQYFPLGHKYMGFCDLVARQNIHDINLQWTAKPSDKLKLLAWYHIFFLDSPTDALYNANGTAIRIDPTGNSGSYVGNEIDLTAQYFFNPRTDLLIGYSHFFPGDFVINTNPAGVSGEVNFYYMQFSWKF